MPGYNGSASLVKWEARLSIGIICCSRERYPPMNSLSKGKRVYSRRDFFKVVPISIASGLIFGSLSRTLSFVGIGRRRNPPVFPKGSIFTPAKRSGDEI